MMSEEIAIQKVRYVGFSYTLTIPSEAVQRLKIKRGSKVRVLLDRNGLRYEFIH